MSEIFKVNLDQNKKSHASWLVMTIKNITKKTVKELRLPVLSLKCTQESALQNNNILYAFNGNLCEAM